MPSIFKLRTISFEGRKEIRSHQQTSPKCELVGESNVFKIKIEGKECDGLIDTGSMVTTVGEEFYRQELNNIEMKSLATVLQIEGAGGQCVPYLGMIEVGMTIPGSEEMDVPVLVVPATNFNTSVPVIVGTNVLKAAKKTTACMSTQIGSIVKAMEPKEDMIVHSKEEIVLEPNSSSIVEGYIKDEIGFTEGSIEPSESLPGGVVVPATVGLVQEGKVMLYMVNMAKRRIRIPPKQKIAYMVNHKVLDHKERKSKEDGPKENEKSPSNKPVKLNLEDTDLNERQKRQVQNLCNRYGDVFATKTVELGTAKGVKQKIVLSNNTPFQERARRIPPGMYQEVKQHIQEMLACGAIRHSHSPWASNVVFVRKKDGSLRLCLDFRRLNSQTVRDAYMLPLIESTLDGLAGAKYFTSLDLQSGYWQVEIEEEDKPKTAFRVEGVGFFECNRMPFGLTNAPAVFQRLMEQTLADLSNALVYIDDIIVHSKDFKQHLVDLEECFKRLKKAGLKLKPSKCHLFKREVKYLGHYISDKGV